MPRPDKKHCFLIGIGLTLLICLISSCGGGGGGTSTTVTTTRDNQGIWFITGNSGATLENIFDAQGYNEAVDRMWQGELYRRTARGKLAEIFGSSQLSTDIFMRTIGYSDTELQEGFDALDAESRTVIQAYVDGFNRRIAEVTADASIMPFEFRAIGITPEPWTVLDMLAWSALLQRQFDPEATSQYQIDNMALYATLAATFPASFQGMFADLRWTKDPDALTYYCDLDRNNAGKSAVPGPVLPAGTDYTGLAQEMSGRFDAVENNLKEINAFVKMGSYAWVIDGTKSASGNPIIYSGPQMGFSVPAIVLEGSIRAGDLNVSGMSVVGIPGIIIGRTPHHAWSMQVANAHTVDYYIESPANVSLNRYETIKVAGQDDVILPVFRSSHGPVINPMPYDPSAVTASNPAIAWKYSHWGYEFNMVRGMLQMARAQSMDDFQAGLDYLAVSQHFCYADTAGNIAYWMSGRDPVRPIGNWMLPQGFGGAPQLEWDSAVIKNLSNNRNTSKGYYCGWNNKDCPESESGMNSASKQFGPYDRAHVVDDYLAAHDNLTFEQVRDLIQNITTTDSFDNGGNPWKFVSEDFTAAVTGQGLTAERQQALDILAAWDGHFVDGGSADWVSGTDRADGWMLMDAWLEEVIRLTFADELGSLYDSQNREVLFNVILHALAGAESGIVNNYNWFQNLSDPSAPQTSDTIVTAALDTALASLGARPWGTGQRDTIEFTHDLIGKVHEMPFSNRSTYAHCVEVSAAGPARIESMFPLGQSGNMTMKSDGMPDLDDTFFSMTTYFDNMVHRPFPIFD